VPPHSLTGPHFRTLAIATLSALLLVAGLHAYARWTTPETAHRTEVAARSRASQPPRPIAPPPKIEPLILLDMTPDEARAFNASIPFVDAPKTPARPFIYSGTPEDRERALTCLAGAAWYEAGDDPTGEQAVAQVVLNRVRHPAYPKNICGVVFQGAERTTGCQFTFTCDGSLARVPSADAWKRARAIAERALTGFVFKAIGTATHYHTDWVVPYWSASLDKVSEVHTHLFFRWRGWWGQPGAFSGRYLGSEQLDPRIAPLSEAPIGPATAGGIGTPILLADVAPPPRPALAIEGVPAARLQGNIVRLIDPDTGQYVLELDPKAYPGSYAVVALTICRNMPVCSVIGWLKPDNIPAALPAPAAAMHSMSFLYRRNRPLDREQVYWNCQQLPRANASQCLPGTEPQIASAKS
jgi:spore germination cell wall hydrolase CwlJ-like protein